MFGRFEDDEFAADHRAATIRTPRPRVADKLIAALAAPIFMDQMWQIGVSIGIAQAPEDGTTADELYRRAVIGAARRQAQRPRHRCGASCRKFTRSIPSGASSCASSKPRSTTKAFDVHYQPVVAAEGGGMIGVEALLRWTPSDARRHCAVDVHSARRESGLMNKLGEIVLRRALADGARWPNLFVSVNLSPVQMRDPGSGRSYRRRPCAKPA